MWGDHSAIKVLASAHYLAVWEHYTREGSYTSKYLLGGNRGGNHRTFSGFFYVQACMTVGPDDPTSSGSRLPAFL